MALSRQFDNVLGVPERFGTQPIPEGHVRVNHYTTEDAIPSIREHGLLVSKAQESFARGGTEFPSTFATAGMPAKALVRMRPVVEAHIPVTDLDIGGVGGRPVVATKHLDQQARDLENYQSTVTTNVDVPAENIIAVHEPWHETFRYMQDNPQMEQDIMSGFYDDAGGTSESRAINATKVALAAKVMLGVPLGRADRSNDKNFKNRPAYDRRRD